MFFNLPNKINGIFSFNFILNLTIASWNPKSYRFRKLKLNTLNIRLNVKFKTMNRNYLKYFPTKRLRALQNDLEIKNHFDTPKIAHSLTITFSCFFQALLHKNFKQLVIKVDKFLLSRLQIKKINNCVLFSNLMLFPNILKLNNENM
ncbi:hypothetical protein BpHYR1_017039 [Brachionus plicatilis]|uniref:Uncharacterized protein n=1 Tax=Brachionus plicatilis TaxID=10195 RepID=A0A3M7SQX2_BRAPC|nr:hypothetical protein BpHYR1_017039 [Brachionus plicatilis]